MNPNDDDCQYAEQRYTIVSWQTGLTASRHAPRAGHVLGLSTFNLSPRDTTTAGTAAASSTGVGRSRSEIRTAANQPMQLSSVFGDISSLARDRSMAMDVHDSEEAVAKKCKDFEVKFEAEEHMQFAR